MKLIKYRIETDECLGYRCYIWRIWFPFWVTLNWWKSHKTVKEAEEFINRCKNSRLVKDLD
jgi:hypothetical protein